MPGTDVDFFDVFAADSSLRILHRRNVPPAVLLAAVPLTLAVVVAAAASAGLLGMRHLSTAMCQDFANLVSSTRLGCRAKPVVVHQMPLLRDWPSLACAVIAALTPYLVYRQWTGFRDLVPSLTRFGLVGSRQPGTDGAARFHDEVADVNAFIRNRSSASVLPGLVAVVAMLAITFGTSRSIYPAFAPDGVSGWSDDAADRWWAGSTASPAGFAAYFLIGYVAVYYLVRMNLVGARIVLALWRVRLTVRFGMDVDNRDGNYGWGPVREILTATYLAIVLDGIGLVALLLAVGASGVLLLLPVLGQWLVLLPFYTVVPVVAVVRNVREYKRVEVERLTALLSTIPDTDLAARGPVIQRLDRVHQLPLVPFGKWRVLGGWIMGFTSGLLTFAGIASSIWGG